MVDLSKDAVKQDHVPLDGVVLELVRLSFVLNKIKLTIKIKSHEKSKKTQQTSAKGNQRQRAF